MTTACCDPFNMFNGDSMIGQMFQMGLMSKATSVANNMLGAQEAQAIAMSYMSKKTVLDSMNIEVPTSVKSKVLKDLGLSVDES